MLYSFDVFDTLITRRTATPKGIFAVMQSSLQNEEEFQNFPTYIRDNFYWLRIQSEQLARLYYQQRYGWEDITLEQIYEALETTGVLDNQQKAQLIALERKMEFAHVVGISSNIAQVKGRLTDGHRVVLISDMYLDAATILHMLVKVDRVFNDIPLYVSSEFKVGKYTGNLYHQVKKIENACFDSWIHYGDNIHSDVTIPIGLGIQAKCFSYEPLLSIEKTYLTEYPIDVQAQYQIGAARNTRLFQKINSLPKQIGCSIGGPILFSYVFWILKEASHRKIRRLYFIARDGYILNRIANCLIMKWHLPIHTKYIYGSRKVWRLPSYDGSPEMLRQLVIYAYPPMIDSIEKLSHIFQLPINIFLDFLPIEYREEKQKISILELSYCVQYLVKQNRFCQFLYQYMISDREKIKKYLLQEINVSDNAFAFVDLGGTGFTQHCLAKIVQEFCSFPIQTFFFKLDQIRSMPGCIHYNFFPSVLPCHLLIEMICRASHGQTDGYCEQNGKIVPILHENEGIVLKNYGYDDYIVGVMEFIHEYIKFANPMGRIHIQHLLYSIQYLAEYKDHHLSDFFADMPNRENGLLDDVPRFAPRLTKKQIRNLFLFHVGEPIKRYYEGTDLALSRKRCTKAEEAKILFYQKNRDALARRFARIMKRPLLAGVRPMPGMETFPLHHFGRVVLYGAGKFGQCIYRDIRPKHVQLVAWLDQRAEYWKDEGLPVDGTMDLLPSLAFDHVLVAIWNPETASRAKQEIAALGIHDDAIVCLREYRQQLIDYLKDRI